MMLAVRWDIKTNGRMVISMRIDKCSAKKEDSHT